MRQAVRHEPVGWLAWTLLQSRDCRIGARRLWPPHVVDDDGQTIDSPSDMDIIHNLMWRTVRSFASNKEMLSNSIAFWMAGACFNAGADPSAGTPGWVVDKVVIPGLGAEDYPAQTDKSYKPAKPSSLPGADVS